MGKLIDADKFRSELDNHYPFTKDEQSKHGMADIAKSTVLLVLKATPSVDAVEVVRCKDCNWWKYFNGGLGNCKHPKFGEPLTENYHFCGYGERKDGDGNENH